MGTSRTLAHADVGAASERWTVLDNDARYRGNKRAYLCRCACGTERVLAPSDFLKAKTKSCGCLNAELARERATTHGRRYTKLNAMWSNMRSRCANPKHVSWDRYGGRGIRVCAEWDDFTVFRAWALENGYKEDVIYRQEIDRIDNDGNYEPDNCQVVAPRENRQHTSTSHNLTAFGVTKSMGAWADDRRCEVDYHTLRSRINRGWPTEKALSTPPRSYSKTPRP